MELLLRCLIGGVVVSLFSILGDVIKPKSLAGITAATPAVALATLVLTWHSKVQIIQLWSAARWSRAPLLT